jgi:tetratricopeptide (TPR) repeat protein
MTKIDPKNFEAYRNLGSFYLMEKENESALLYLGKAQDVKPTEEIQRMIDMIK